MVVIEPFPSLPSRNPRIVPIENSFISSSHDVWTVDSENTYKILTPNTESDISQLSVNFDDNDLNIVRSDPVVPRTNQSSKTKCPWKIPWVAITNCCLQIIVYYFQSKRLTNLLIYSPYKKNESWRFLTYSLLHSDVIHLIVNVFLQIIAAFPLETEQGHFNVIVVYVSGILTGSLGTSVFQKELLIIGSSAGVYSLLLSHVPHLVLNFSSLPYRYYRVISVIVICFNDILLTTLHCIQDSNVEPKIGLAAHISGGLCGLVIGFALYSGKRTTLLKLVRHVAIILYSVFIIVLILLNLK